MYKIMTLVRDGTKPLWTPYMAVKEVVLTPPVTEPDTGSVIAPAVTESKPVEYEVETLEELEETVKELIATVPSKQIKVVEDLTYTIDILFTV